MKHYKINSKNLFNNSYIKLINKEIIININNLDVDDAAVFTYKKIL